MGKGKRRKEREKQMSKQSMPDVSGIIKAATVAQLENELRRRGCAVAVITPEDVRSQWDINQDADGDDADPCPPTDAEIEAALRTVGAELADCLYDNYGAGPTSEACEIISKRRRQAEGKGKSK